jgi:hypothetical protein
MLHVWSAGPTPVDFDLDYQEREGHGFSRAEKVTNENGAKRFAAANRFAQTSAAKTGLYLAHNGTSETRALPFDAVFRCSHPLKTCKAGHWAVHYSRRDRWH